MALTYSMMHRTDLSLKSAIACIMMLRDDLSLKSRRADVAKPPLSLTATTPLGV